MFDYVSGIQPGKVAHAHYILPKEHAADFARKGINVHDPKFGAWWEAKNHLETVWEYNQKWLMFFEKNPKGAGIFKQALKMAEEYKFNANF